MRSELRCLAAGQPSRPISVEAPLWSQVVGSAYREDQQRSVSLLRSLSLHLLPLSLSFLFSALSPFGITPPPPPSCFSPQITIFPSTSYHCCPSFSFPPSPHAVSLAGSKQAKKCFSFQTSPPLWENLMRSTKM